MLGDVTTFGRYVSPTVDARERQWRHFYYAQDTWRVNPKLTLNYGLRLDVINPQTLNEPGNGGFLDLDTGLIRVAGVGGVGMNGDIENTLNWAPRVGATYQIDEKTVIRGGYGRSYDIGVFGSLFGHSVTQNLPVLSIQQLNAPENFDSVFNLSNGPPPPVFPDVPSSGEFPLPNGVFARALPEKQTPPHVDAFNVTVQRELTSTMSMEVAYVGNRGGNVFAGDGPAININQASILGYPGVPRNSRRPYFNEFGWTQDIDYFCNCATNSYDALQAKLTKRFSDGYSVQVNYTLQKAEQDSGEYFQTPLAPAAGLFDTALNRGPADWDRTHNFVFSVVAELPVGRGRTYLTDVSSGDEPARRGMAAEHEHVHSERPAVQRHLSQLRRGPRHRAQPSGSRRRSGRDRRRATSGSTRRPIGEPGSAFARPAAGTFGNLPRNELRGPGYWRVDASLFKHFDFAVDRAVEVRFEVVNLFNHVNLGNPDSEVGVPGNPNPNAGRINSTAQGGNDLQRNFQFGVKLRF